MNKNLLNTLWRTGSVLVECEIKRRYRALNRRKSLEDEIDEVLELIRRVEASRAATTSSTAKYDAPVDNNSTEDDAPELWTESIKRGANKPPRQWIVPKLIPANGIINIMSREKQGKSIFSTQIALSAISSQPSEIFNDSGDEKRCDVQHVIIYDVEQDDEDMVERYGELMNVSLENLLRKNKSFETLDGLVAHMEKFIPTNKNCLVVLDNMTSIVDSALSAKQVNMLFGRMKNLKEKAEGNGCQLTFILVHHTTKNSSDLETESRAGSVNYGRRANVNLALGPSNHGENFRILKVQNTRCHDCLPEGTEIVLQKHDDLYPHFEFVSIVGENKNTSSGTKFYDQIPEAVFRKMLNDYKPNTNGSGIGAVAKKYGFPKCTFQRALEAYNAEKQSTDEQAEE